MNQEVIFLQPIPIDVTVTHFLAYGQTYSAIARLWHQGDPARCRLCEHCELAGNPAGRMCNLVVNEYVPRRRAALYSTVGAANVTPPVQSSDEIPLPRPARAGDYRRASV